MQHPGQQLRLTLEKIFLLNFSLFLIIRFIDLSYPLGLNKIN